MSSPYSLEHLADIRDGARRMVERTRAHEGDLPSVGSHRTPDVLVGPDEQQTQ
jgi:hypothetical protein